MALKSKSKGGGRRSSFQYHERDSESVRKRAEQQGGRFDSIVKSGFDTWRPTNKESCIRILPPTWDDHEHYGYDIWVHSFVGPDKSTYLCPKKMLNKACPICKASAEASRAGEDDEAKALAATRRVAVWLLDRDADRATPALWSMSWTMDRDIAALCQNKKTGKVLLIDNPRLGYDVMFNRTGKGLNTRYSGLVIDREETPALDDDDELESVLEYIQENPIPSVLNFYDEDYLANVIDGTAEETDKDLEEEEAPRASSRAASRRREEPEEEEEEDDPPPRRSSRPAARPDPEDEPDEDPPPRSARSKPTRPASTRRTPVDEEEEEEEDLPPRRSPPAGRRPPKDEPEEEEEDAPPPRRSARGPIPREDEPDEPDEPEEEEEEDDPPPRRSSRPAARR